MKDSRTSDANLGNEEPRPPVDIAEQRRRFEAWAERQPRAWCINRFMHGKRRGEYDAYIVQLAWEAVCAALGIEGVDINGD